jgi:hypothetical protein
MISLRLAVVSAGGSPLTEPSVPASGADVLGADVEACKKCRFGGRFLVDPSAGATAGATNQGA